MYACIDLGSNSFHILIGEWTDRRIEIVERCSESVQLGEDLHKTGNISAAAFQRGLDCLQHFKSLMDGYPLERYWALGTNAFRVADNSERFIAAAQDVGLEVSTLSGVQEAVLIYAGVATALPESDRHRLVIDIGGGSSEVIVGRQSSRLLTESLAIGCVSWRDRFFAAADASEASLDRQLLIATAAATEVFDGISTGISRAAWHEAYASSGTVKMLASICQSHGFTAGEISLQALGELRPTLLAAIAEGRELPGLKPRRRELLLPGWAVLVGLMRACAVERIRFSATALREGMLDFLVKNKKTLPIMQNSALPQVSLAES